MTKKNRQDINYEEHKDLFDYAELSAKKAYNKFRNKIPTNVWSIEDFISEANITACNSIIKFKDKENLDIFKLGKMAVYWRLQDILQKSRLYSKYFIRGNSLSCSNDINGTQVSQEQFLDFIKNSSTIATTGIKFSDLTSICDDREYDILVQKIRDGKTFKSIADNFNTRKGRGKHKTKFTKQGIMVIYNKALNKVKKIYFEK